jgi:OOP family OmpA-OmpF porin
MVTVKAADMADALSSKGFIDLYGVYFDTDKTDVKPDSKATLDEIASLLKIDHSLKLEVSGHTDNSGDKAHNMTLSQGRADAVKAMLVSKYGIDAKRLTAKGYGDTKPVAPNTTDAGKAKNRRVELRKV